MIGKSWFVWQLGLLYLTQVQDLAKQGMEFSNLGTSAGHRPFLRQYSGITQCLSFSWMHGDMGSFTYCHLDMLHALQASSWFVLKTWPSRCDWLGLMNAINRIYAHAYLRCREYFFGYSEESYTRTARSYLRFYHALALLQRRV